MEALFLVRGSVKCTEFSAVREHCELAISEYDDPRALTQIWYPA